MTRDEILNMEGPELDREVATNVRTSARLHPQPKGRPMKRKRLIAILFSGLFLLALMDILWLNPHRYSSGVQPTNTEQVEDMGSDM